MSDMVSSAFGSLAMMTSVLVSPQGYYEYEAAHGTVQRHYYQSSGRRRDFYQLCGNDFCMDRSSSVNVENWMAIRNWIEFADKLEKATLATIESGKMTKDLALITTIENPTVLNSRDFILAIQRISGKNDLIVYAQKSHCINCDTVALVMWERKLQLCKFLPFFI